MRRWLLGLGLVGIGAVGSDRITVESRIRMVGSGRPVTILIRATERADHRYVILQTDGGAGGGASLTRINDLGRTYTLETRTLTLRCPIQRDETDACVYTVQVIQVGTTGACSQGRTEIMVLQGG